MTWRGSGENSATSMSKKSAMPASESSSQAASAARACTAPDTSPRSDIRAWQSSIAFLAWRLRRAGPLGLADTIRRLRNEAASMRYLLIPRKPSLQEKCSRSNAGRKYFRKTDPENLRIQLFQAFHRFQALL